MSVAPVKQKNTVYYINTCITIILFLGIGHLPPFGQITPMGMKVLAVFIGMLYGWLTVGFAWPSIFGTIMLGLSGAMSVNQAFSSGWGNVNAVIMVIMACALANYLDQCKLTDAIAGFFLTRKFVDGKPYAMICMIFVAAYVIGAFTSLFAGIFVMWAILYKVMDLVGYEKRSLRSCYLLGMVVYSANLGGLFLPFHASAIMYTGFIKQSIEGLAIPYAQYMVFQFFAMLALMIGYVLVGKFLLRLDFSALANTENFAMYGGKKLNFEQKFGLIDLLFMVILLLIPDLLPKTNPVAAFMKSLGVVGVFGLAMIVPAIIKKDGKPLMNISECTKNTPWDIIWLLVATMPVAAAMQSADSGILSTMVGGVMGVIGNMSWITFTIITTIILGLATQVMHNLIIAAVLFGPLALICQQLGGNPVVWFMVNYIVNMAAFMTPAGSGTSAILHGNSEWVRPRDAYLLGTLWLIISVVFVTLVGVSLGQVLF